MTAEHRGSSQPGVTLVIPSHKRGARILPTLQSALAQTKPFDEIIVVNDGGAAETREAVGTLSSAIRVLDTSQSGAAEARNIGARAATEPILVLLDDDDVLQPHANATLFGALLAFPDARASFGDHTFRDFVTGEYRSDHFHLLPHYERFRQLKPLAHAENKVGLYGRNLHVILLKGNLLGQPWMVWRDTYLETGGFVSGLGSADDWDLYLRITRRHKVAIADRVISDHFREAGRVHLTTADGQEQKQMAVALRQLRMAGLGDYEAQTTLRRKIAGHCKSFGDTARAEHPWRARWHYLQSLRWWPFDLVAAVRAVHPRIERRRTPPKGSAS